MTKIKPAAPDVKTLETIFLPGLLSSKVYKIDTPKVKYKLDQNESPFDWPEDLKEKICQDLCQTSWNRYPAAHARDVEDLIAEYLNLENGTVLLSPGSNHLLGIILSNMTKKLPGKLVIARPSFVLYESHCRNEGIPYETWNLNEDLQYDLNALPELPAGSIVLFASPNNPVGNTLAKSDLKKLLVDFPEVIFISDEAYFEFSDENTTDLLAEHSNLLIMRTFSKTMGAAGIRLGYLIGHSSYIGELRKQMLPFLVNQFAYIAAKHALSNSDFLSQVAKTTQLIVDERSKVETALRQAGETKNFEVIPSKSNFILLRWKEDVVRAKVYSFLIENDILIRDISRGPNLSGCMRLSIGSKEANQAVIKVFSSAELPS